MFDGIPEEPCSKKLSETLSETAFGQRDGLHAQPIAEAEPVMRFRTIWISDIHLGTTGCQAALLLEFLKHTESNELYLVGDIIDGWQLKRKWYWHRHHNDVVQKILRKARKGTKVTFVAGNHDEFARQFLGLAFGDIAIVDEAVHVTAQGKRLLILHGDQFDAVVQCAKWLAHIGDYLYGVALDMNRWLNAIRRRIGKPYWSLSQYLKHRVKNAVSYINAFEEAVAHEAKKRGMDGVVCGHIHRPEMRDIDGITYCNDGDWVESLSALVETEAGELKIIYWHDVEAWCQRQQGLHTPQEVEGAPVWNGERLAVEC